MSQKKQEALQSINNLIKKLYEAQVSLNETKLIIKKYTNFLIETKEHFDKINDENKKYYAEYLQAITSLRNKINNALTKECENNGDQIQCAINNLNQVTTKSEELFNNIRKLEHFLNHSEPHKYDQLILKTTKEIKQNFTDIEEIYHNNITEPTDNINFQESIEQIEILESNIQNNNYNNAKKILDENKKDWKSKALTATGIIVGAVVLAAAFIVKPDLAVLIVLNFAATATCAGLALADAINETHALLENQTPIESLNQSEIDKAIENNNTTLENLKTSLATKKRAKKIAKAAKYSNLASIGLGIAIIVGAIAVANPIGAAVAVACLIAVTAVTVITYKQEQNARHEIKEAKEYIEKLENNLEALNNQKIKNQEKEKEKEKEKNSEHNEKTCKISDEKVTELKTLKKLGQTLGGTGVCTNPPTVISGDCLHQSHSSFNPPKSHENPHPESNQNPHPESHPKL